MADDAGKIETLYDTDVVAWAEQQAEALRVGDASLSLLDYENLAEEIEDLAKIINRACRSLIDRIIEHLLKLEYADPSMLERNLAGWQVSVRNQRDKLEYELTPTLARRLPDDVANRYAKQVGYLVDLGLISREDASQAQERGSYSWSQVTEDRWSQRT